MMVLANGNSTVSDWLEFIGPEDPVDAIERQPDSIRALYGNTDPEVEALRVKNLQNAVHGSLTVSAAAREIRFFFPDEVGPCGVSSVLLLGTSPAPRWPNVAALLKCCVNGVRRFFL